MFGFLRPARPDAAYRRTYARVCRLQRGAFGVRTLPLLSYESVFLHRLLAEAGACPPPPDSAPTCCRLRSAGDDGGAPDAAVGRFCAAFGLVLASVKLEDDVRDDRSPLARLARRVLRTPIDRAFAVLGERDPGYRDRSAAWVAAHLALERAGRPVPVREYSEPTASAFGETFALAAALLPDDADAADRLWRIGRGVGAAIVANDCAADFDRDRRRGRFNPLSGQAGVRAAKNFAAAALTDAGWCYADWFGPRSPSARLLRGRIDRLSPDPPAPADGADRTAARRVRMERWGLLRDPRYVYARFDCCPCDGCGECAAGCDGCDIPDCGGADAGVDAGADAARGAGCGCVPVFCCDGCELCVCCGERSRGRAGSDDGGPPADDATVGRTGVAVTPLGPTGLVEVAGARLPARSHGPWIDAGIPVVVVRATEFGVEVRPADGAGA